MNKMLIMLVAILIAHASILLWLFMLVIRTIKRFYIQRYYPNSIYSIRLVSLGITALLFSNTLYKITISPLILLVKNITDISSYLYQSAASFQSNQTGNSDFDIGNIGNSYVEYLKTFPIGRFLFAIGTGVILYYFIRYCRDNSTTPQTPNTSTNNALLYNLIIVGVLSFSLFLVVSVFISIPYLNEIKKPSFFTVNGLDSALVTMRTSDSNNIKKDIGPSPFYTGSIKDTLFKDVALESKYKRLSGTALSTFEQLVSSIDERKRVAELNRNTSKTQIEQSLNQYSKNKYSNYQRLKQIYLSNSQSNLVDKDLLYTTCINQYKLYLDYVNKTIDQVGIFFSFTDQASKDENSKLFRQLRDFLNTTAEVKDSISAVNYPNINATYSDYTIYNLNLSDAINWEVAFEPVKRDGSDWSFFGAIARYLIKTESLDLVLLIGMLGFGLLGASLSSFQLVGPIDNAGNNQTTSMLDSFIHAPIIKNFWSVLARGFSAAILIYLATKGGIAILTANTSSDPNGYILLLLCFIGAVFSEKVWNAAKTKYGL